MVPVHLRGHARLGRVRHARLRTTMRALLLMMRSVVRVGLVLRISRLGRRHAIVMHAALIPRAVRPVEHCIWRRWTVGTGTRR